MYSTCLFCTKDSSAPTTSWRPCPSAGASRLMWPRGGCGSCADHCAKWNLVPFDSRLETIDACERLFRGTTMRYSTENIGLFCASRRGLSWSASARHNDLSLRDGATATRSGVGGDRNLLIAGGVAAAGIAVVSGGLALGVSFGMLGQLPNYYNLFVVNRRVTVRVPRADGPPIETHRTCSRRRRSSVRRSSSDDALISHRQVIGAVQRQQQAAEGRVARDRVHRIGEAEQILAGVLVRLNRWGGYAAHSCARPSSWWNDTVTVPA